MDGGIGKGRAAVGKVSNRKFPGALVSLDRVLCGAFFLLINSCILSISCLYPGPAIYWLSDHREEAWCSGRVVSQPISWLTRRSLFFAHAGLAVGPRKPASLWWPRSPGRSRVTPPNLKPPQSPLKQVWSSSLPAPHFLDLPNGTNASRGGPEDERHVERMDST